MTTVEVPLKTPNMTNQREHHMARHRRAKAQRAATLLALKMGMRGNPLAFWGQPLIITLTRVSPGTLDAHDNLRSALKSVVDAVAEYFGNDDADPRFEWRYAQATGKAAVRISFEVKQ